MKKTFVTKALSILMMIVLLVPLFTACGNSKDRIRPYEWEASQDGDIIRNEDRMYYKYDLPVGYEIDFSPIYSFKNYVGMDYERSVYSYARDGEIITLSYCNNSEYCYVTSDGRQSIDSLVNGTVLNPYLYSDGYLYQIDQNTIINLNAIWSGTSIEVSELRYLDRYDIRRYDETRSVYRVSGALYEYKGALWYLNYDILGNEHFDSDGNFSYRQGEVMIYEVISKPSLYYDIRSITSNGEEISDEYIYERKDIKPEREKMDPEDRARAWFWVMYSLVAFAVPAWPFTMGILNSRSKKHGKRKIWLIQSIAALIWVLIGLVVMLLLI